MPEVPDELLCSWACMLPGCTVSLVVMKKPKLFNIPAIIANPQPSSNLGDRAFFLPKFSSSKTLLDLLATALMVAVVLTLAPLPSLHSFSWGQFSMVLVFNIWVTVSFAFLCDLLRPFLLQVSRAHARYYAIAIFLLVVAVCSIMGAWLQSYIWWHSLSWQSVFSRLFINLIIAFFLSSSVMYYLYIREQLVIRHRSEWVARTQSLQSKIRPHFLFNAMSNLRGLIQIDPNKAEEAISDLSALFRASLNAKGEVPIEEEIALCDRYLALEKLRLGDRLTVNWDLPSSDAMYDINIPSLTLQPLLENAVYHGVESRIEPSTITIRLENSDGEVRIVVKNPFITKTHSNKLSNGIALANTRERLQAYYGPSALLSTSSVDNVFTVYISYPEQTWNLGIAEIDE